ncbi:MAG: hypothetical protein SPG30_03835 [Peptostreptococcus porci]|nr:hypothetical protein [Peptostreptococcus porci]
MSFKKTFIAGICSVILIMPFSSVANVNNNSDIVTVKEFGKIEKQKMVLWLKLEYLIYLILFRLVRGR